MKLLLRLLFRVLFRLRLVNFNNLKLTEPTVILPNHISLLDGVFLYLFLPKEVVFVVNTHIAKRYALVLKFCRFISIDPLNPYSLKQIVHTVKAGTPIVLFPEGRITTTGGLMKIYDGLGFIAQKTRANLYPIIFTGLDRSLASRLKIKIKTKWFPKVQIYVGKPFKLTTCDSKSPKGLKKELSDNILEYMQKTMYEAKHQEQVNLFNQLLEAAKINGSKNIVVRDVTQKMSYRKVIMASYIMSRKLNSFIQHEENIGVLLPNSNGHVITLFALFYSGKTPAILNFSAGMQNVLACAETAKLKTILTSRLFIEKAGLSKLANQLAVQYRLIYLEDIKETLTVTDKLMGIIKYVVKKKASRSFVQRLILFTSGSENKPKGVILNHSNVMANINQLSCVVDFTSQDRFLNVLPMFHSFGLTVGTLLPILGGVEVYLYPNPLHYKIIPEIAYDYNATILFGTSSFLDGYAKYAHPYDFYNIRYVFAGAEKLKEETKTVWQDKFGIRIMEGYGTTEASPVLSLNTSLFYRKGTVGKFLPGILWRLEDVEGIQDGKVLLVKGPNVMEGYLLHGKGFIPVDEWYNTGDLVSTDEQGFITIKSRIKRFAKISGEMVSLNLVEQLAEKCFGTTEIASINIPDARKGEKIIVFTTRKDVSKQTFREYIRQNDYSMLLLPSEIKEISTLPLLGSGKNDYVTIRNLALKGN